MTDQTVTVTIVYDQGRYRIRVPSLGISFSSPYPENRVAKVLDLAGIAGSVIIVDGITGQERMRFSIEREARKRFSEGEEGFRRLSWTEGSLAPLRELAQKANRAAEDRRKPPSPAHLPIEEMDAVLGRRAAV